MKQANYLNKAKNRGQVTLFIIMGIVILTVFLFIMYMASVRVREDVEGKGKKAMEDAAFDVSPVREYIQKCMNDVAEDALEILGRDGGVIYYEGGNQDKNYLANNKGKTIVEYKVIEDDGQTKNTFYIWVAGRYGHILHDYEISLKEFESDNSNEKTMVYQIKDYLERMLLERSSEVAGHYVIYESGCLAQDEINDGLFQYEVSIDALSGSNPLREYLDISVNNQDIVVTLDVDVYALEKATGKKMLLEPISITLNTHLKDIHNLVTYLLDKDMEDYDFKITDPSKYSVERENVVTYGVSVDNDGPLEVGRHDIIITDENRKFEIFKITDHGSRVHDRPFEFYFAREDYPADVREVFFTKHMPENVDEGFITSAFPLLSFDEITATVKTDSYPWTIVAGASQGTNGDGSLISIYEGRKFSMRFSGKDADDDKRERPIVYELGLPKGALQDKCNYVESSSVMGDYIKDIGSGWEKKDCDIKDFTINNNDYSWGSSYELGDEEITFSGSGEEGTMEWMPKDSASGVYEIDIDSVSFDIVNDEDEDSIFERSNDLKNFKDGDFQRGKLRFPVEVRHGISARIKEIYGFRYFGNQISATVEIDERNNPIDQGTDYDYVIWYKWCHKGASGNLVGCDVMQGTGGWNKVIFNSNDGEVQFLKSISKYSNSWNYGLKVVVVDNFGNVAVLPEDEITVTLSDELTVSIENSNGDKLLTGQEYRFSALVDGGRDPRVELKVNDNLGNTVTSSTETTLVHTFNSKGRYKIILEASDDDDSNPSTAEKVIKKELELDVYDPLSISIDVTPAKTDDVYCVYDRLRFNAIINGGYNSRFDGWSGSLSGDTNPISKLLYFEGDFEVKAEASDGLGQAVTDIFSYNVEDCGGSP